MYVLGHYVYLLNTSFYHQGLCIQIMHIVALSMTHVHMYMVMGVCLSVVSREYSIPVDPARNNEGYAYVTMARGWACYHITSQRSNQVTIASSKNCRVMAEVIVAGRLQTLQPPDAGAVYHAEAIAAG